MKGFMTKTLFLIFAVSIFSACGTLGASKWEKQASEKVAKMQELVGFSDAQATKIKKAELNFLQKVAKVKKCKACDVATKLQELLTKKTTLLQNVLNRQQYLKYNAVEKELMKGAKLIAD